MSEEEEEEEEELVTIECRGETWKMPKYVLSKALNLANSQFQVSQSRIIIKTCIESITVGCAVSTIAAANGSDVYGLSACQNKSCRKAKRIGGGCGRKFSGKCKICNRILCDDCDGCCEWCSANNNVE